MKPHIPSVPGPFRWIASESIASAFTLLSCLTENITPKDILGESPIAPETTLYILLEILVLVSILTLEGEWREFLRMEYLLL